MSTESKNIRLISKLLDATQNGKLTWRVVEPSNELTRGTDSVVETTYVTRVATRTFRLVPYKVRVSMDGETYFWEDEVALELSDEHQTTWWRFPHYRAIEDLLQAVKYKMVDVDTIVDDLLSEDELPI